jgi:hypothetical protein
MSEEVENILRAFNFNAELALNQYLIACEIDDVNIDPVIVDELETWKEK